jgi:hypothetical protein
MTNAWRWRFLAAFILASTFSAPGGSAGSPPVQKMPTPGQVGIRVVVSHLEIGKTVSVCSGVTGAMKELTEALAKEWRTAS